MRRITGFVLLCLSALFFQSAVSPQGSIIAFEVEPWQHSLALYWKDSVGRILNNFEALKKHCAAKNEELVFATNGGMFTEDFSPLGLYKENQKEFRKLNTDSGNGNFYLKPNGVFFFYGKGKEPGIMSTELCETYKDVMYASYATQSGPMLLINGSVHPAFTKGSTNLNIRNGVGILPNGHALFVIATEAINFYDFAMYFKKRGCKDALYLDGFVSRVWQEGRQIPVASQNFGVMVGVTKRK